MPKEKINQHSLAETLIAGGGVHILVASFFDWWHYTVQGFGGVGSDGWSAPGSIWSTLAILISLALAAIVAATRLSNMQMPALPQNLSWGQVWGGGGAAIAVLMLLKTWRILAAPIGGFGIGYFIGLIAAAAVVYGCYVLYTQEKGASRTT
jgi:hypothetical protein